MVRGYVFEGRHLPDATRLAVKEVSTKEHKPCYGKLFPSAASRQSSKETPDAPFRYVFEQWGTVRRPPEITVDLNVWDRCVECPEFGSCRQLSTAKVLLEMAVR